MWKAFFTALIEALVRLVRQLRDEQSLERTRDAQTDNANRGRDHARDVARRLRERAGHDDGA